MSRPLVTVRDNGEHPSGPDFSEWIEVNGEREPDTHDLSLHVAFINAAHAKAVEPLLAKLAVARAALADFVAVAARVGPVECESASWWQCQRALEIVDTEEVPPMVPKAKLDEALKVLDDLKQENPWRERCEKALAVLSAHRPSRPGHKGSAMDDAIALLEGREPKPAKADGRCSCPVLWDEPPCPVHALLEGRR